MPGPVDDFRNCGDRRERRFLLSTGDHRRRPSGAAFGGIFLLDLLFGWTVIGWLGTLIWACTDEPEQAAGRVPCPFCAEAILPAAKVCPHCRRDLPETFAAQRATFHDPLAPVGRGSPVPSIIVLVIFLILVAGAIYYRHMQFERNSPSFVSAQGVVEAVRAAIVDERRAGK